MTDLHHQVAVAAARKQGRALYHVRHHDGTTLDLVTSEDAARSYLRNGCRFTHLVDIFKVNELGEQHLLHKAPSGGFLLADRCKVIYMRRKANE